MTDHEKLSVTNAQPTEPSQPELPIFEQAAASSAHPVVDPALLAVSIREAYKAGEAHAHRAPEAPKDVTEDPRFDNMVDSAGVPISIARAILSGVITDETSARRWRAAHIRKAATKKNLPHKPRGTSYPQDEGRAEYDFDPNPPASEVLAPKVLEPGETNTGVGLDEMHRGRPLLDHAKDQRELQGLSVRSRVVAEMIRMEKREHARRHPHAS